jgi:hypothetical protein
MTRRVLTTGLMLLLAVGLLAGPALAQPYPPTDVGGVVVEQPTPPATPAAQAEVLGVTVERGEVLAVTGTDIMVLVVAGVALLGLGVLAVRGVRRPAKQS